MKKERRMLVIIALTVTMMMSINNMYGKAFADPAHCDIPGWPSCYKVGYDDGLGMSGSCAIGHSSEFCRGWDDATSGTNNASSSSSPAEQNASNQQATQQNVSTSASNVLTYENPNYGIEMQYPSSWVKNLTVSSPDVVTFYPRGNSSAELTVSVDDISDEKGIPLAQYASDSSDAIKKETQDFRLVASTTNNTLAGLPAYESIYSYAGANNSTVQGMEIGAIKGDKGYIFTYEAGPNE